MKTRTVAVLCGFLLVVLVATPRVGHCENGELLTMERAVEIALEQNLALRISAVELDVAQAELTGARVVSEHNPEISGGAALRRGADELGVDASASLGQTFALGRPRRHRIAAAEANRTIATERNLFKQLQVSAQARVAFATAASAARIVEFAREAEKLTGELHRIAEERQAEDAGTALEVNLAALEWAQARRGLVKSLQDEREARFELLRVLAMDFSRSPRLPVGAPESAPVTESLDELLRRSIEDRPDLLALEGGRRRAEAQLALSRAEAAPDLTVEAAYDYEEQDHIVGVGFTIPLPLFQRNQGEVAQARTRVALSELEGENALRRVERDVRMAYRRYEAALEISDVLDREMIDRSASNLSLLRESFEEGNVGFVEVLLVQRELIAAQRDAVEAALELFLSRVELELAVGGVVR